MSLTLIAITAAVAASLGYLASRRRGASGTDKPVLPPKIKNPWNAQKREVQASDPLASLGLSLGDVVSAEGEERWLAGAIVARDTKLLAAVFIAPEGLAHRAVVAFPSPDRGIQWLAPADVASPAEPPATLEIEGIVMRRRARLPVHLERLGQGAPHVGPSGVLAMYEAGGREAAIVITSEGKCHAWFGCHLDEGEYDRMGRAFDDEPAD